MRVGFLFLILVLVSTVQAQQFAFEYWHAGKAVLDSGDTLRGNIKYDMQSDILQIQIENKLESFTARKILFFEIFDGTVKRYRNFYSLPYSAAGQYKVPIFFELMTEGDVTLLCREALEYRTSTSPFYYYGTYSRLVLVYKYFILRDNGNIEEFKGKKNDWYDLMRKKQSEVEQFVKSNKLDLDDKYELQRVVEYYNSLFSK